MLALLEQMGAMPNEMTPKYRAGGKPMTQMARKADALDAQKPVGTTPNVQDQLLQQIMGGAVSPNMPHPLDPEQPQIDPGAWEQASMLFEQQTGTSPATDADIQVVNQLAMALQAMGSETPPQMPGGNIPEEIAELLMGDEMDKDDRAPPPSGR
jgi:hypothetical protein